MSIITQLKNNKGIISSALGKELAQSVLKKDNTNILSEAVTLTTYKKADNHSKNIRAGAAKIVETVAETRAELVAPHLQKLLPALEMPEAQTRWMIIKTFGFCAEKNPKDSVKAFVYAKKFLLSGEGVCLTGATALYCGNIGALSTVMAEKVFPPLKVFLDTAGVNEVDWALEAFIKIFPKLSNKNKDEVITITKKHINAPKKSTQKRVKKILQNTNSYVNSKLT